MTSTNSTGVPTAKICANAPNQLWPTTAAAETLTFPAFLPEDDADMIMSANDERRLERAGFDDLDSAEFRREGGVQFVDGSE